MDGRQVECPIFRRAIPTHSESEERSNVGLYDADSDENFCPQPKRRALIQGDSATKDLRPFMCCGNSEVCEQSTGAVQASMMVACSNVEGFQQLLRHYYPLFVQNISIMELLPYLNRHQLLTSHENEVLLNQQLTNYERVLHLLQFVERKGKEGFMNFLHAIQEEPYHSGHKEIVQVFRPDCDQSCSSQQIPPILCKKHTTGKNVTHPSILLSPALTPELSSKVLTSQTQLDMSDSSLEGSQLAESMLSMIQRDQSSDMQPETAISKSPCLLYPTGPLTHKSHRFVYTKLFKMAWNGEDQHALSTVKALRNNEKVSLDLKVVSMEVVHTVNSKRDLKLLVSALAYTDRAGCENKSILKCRLHRRIAGLHYRNHDFDDAKDHLETALQLAHQIGPDIDTVYTYRLQALILFEEYKETKNEKARKDSEKYFQLAMDHARQQPDWKRLITERIKISKALFHLDMIKEYKLQNKSEDALEQLELRARETLGDVNKEYLSDGDRAFFHMTSAKMEQFCKDFDGAELHAQRALELNRVCGFEDRVTEAEVMLSGLKQSRET